MKILKADEHYVVLTDGKSRSYNDAIWNFRSACCGAAIERKDNTIICRYCEQEAELISRKAVRQQMADMKGGIEALPEDVRETAIGGFYLSIERGLDDLDHRNRVLAARITRICDRGKG